MRIGYFVWEYPPRIVGGLGTYAQYVAPKMVELGHEVSLFTLNPGNLPTREVVNGVEIHRPLLVNTSDIFPLFVGDELKIWGKHLDFFSDLFVYNILSAAKFVGELIAKEKYKFDVICAHDWLSSIAGMAAKRQTNLPLVFHVHSTERGRTMDGGSEVITRLENTAGEMADKVITVSYPMAEDLARHGWDANKISVAWNGVDTDLYDPKQQGKGKISELRERYGINKDETMILFVGRLTAVKGIINLLKAMPDVIKKHPGAKLVVLGFGELEHNVGDMIRQFGIERNVITRFEFVSEEERILHYGACDIAIFPSLYEPFGIVSLEAMALGKPLVVGASGISGFRDQVVPSGPEQTGIHVDANKPLDIAWGLISLLDYPDKAKEMGVHGRKRVFKHFTMQKIVEETIKLYEEVI
ncbi:glycosyltransferase family 4 protein [archaeon]|nr:glycosyltransferase family 4 protein [archaeon]